MLVLESEAVFVSVDGVLAKFGLKEVIGVITEGLNAKLAAGVVADLDKLPNPVKPANLFSGAGTDEPLGGSNAVTLKLDEKPDPNVRGLNAEVGSVSGFVEPVRARGTNGEVLESVSLDGRFSVDEAELESFEVSYCFVPKLEKADVLEAGI